MNFKTIQRYIKAGNYLFSDHADDEKTKDKLTIEEIEQAILSGVVIEERPDDPRGESCLVVGKTNTGKLLHVIVGTRFDKPVIVTVYLPSAQKWIYGKMRKRRQS